MSTSSKRPEGTAEEYHQTSMAVLSEDNLYHIVYYKHSDGFKLNKVYLDN
jgi:hypothetical protein